MHTFSIATKAKTVPSEVKNLPSSIKLVFMVMTVYFIAWGIAGPFTSLFFKDIFQTYAAATVISGLLPLLRVVFLFPAGEILDRFSEKKMMRVIFLLYLPLWPFLALIFTFVQAVMYQVVHALLATGLWSSAETYTRKNSPKGHRSECWGLFDSSRHVASIAGAIIGGAFLQYVIGDFRIMFLVLPPVFMVAAFLLAKKLPEDEDASNNFKFMQSVKSFNWKKIYLKDLKDFWRVQKLKKLSFFIAMLGFLYWVQIILIPLLAYSLGASFMQIGLIAAFFAMPLLLEIPFSVFADNWSAKGLMVAGSLLAALSSFALIFVNNPLYMFPLAFMLGVSLAMMTPTVSGAATSEMPREHIGEFNSVYSAMFATGGILGLLVAGPLADFAGIHSVFIFSFAVMLVSVVMVFVLWNHKVNC